MCAAKPKLITFDAGGTLLHPYPSVGVVYRRVLEKHGLDYPAETLNRNFADAFRRISKDTSILDGEAREWSFWRAVVLGSIRSFETQPDDFDSLFKDLWEEFSHGDCWRVCEDAHQTLQSLRDSGLTLALLTNWDSRVHRIIRETELDRHFDHVFVSSEIGWEKPDIEIFRHVETVTGCAPEQILHVGDSIKHDIAGANQAGWTALLLASEDEVTDSSAPVIGSLSQVLEWAL